jgi:hypothetical protein
MTTANEYRQFAEECLRWAQAAKTQNERKAFLDMAEIWVKASASIASGGADLDGSVPPFDKHSH